MKDAAVHIVRTLVEAGHEAYFAGGCVRDLLRDVEPIDYDIATSAPPEDVQALFQQSVMVGAQFGVVRVRHGEHEFQVTTFRAEEGYSDGRHPDKVRFTTTPREDVMRRDFTINGMMYDPMTDLLIDYVGGQNDLERKILRCIGDPDRRFREDKLRLMRAVRFASSLDLYIDQPTRRALEKHAADLNMVSIERIRDEFSLILTRHNPHVGVQYLVDTGLAEQFIPEICELKGVPQPRQFHPEGDVLSHVLLMLEIMEQPSLPLALGVLLHDVGKPATFSVKERIRFDRHVEVSTEMSREICVRLRYSNEIIERVSALARNHMRFMNVLEMKQSTLKRFLGMEHFDDHLALHRLDCLGSHGNLDNYRFCVEALERFSDEEIAPPPILTGHDLIAAGYTPGPLFSHILKTVEDAQLEGKISTREEALEMVGKNFPLSPEKDEGK